jgi:hypothetical protein
MIDGQHRRLAVIDHQRRSRYTSFKVLHITPIHSAIFCNQVVIHIIRPEIDDTGPIQATIVNSIKNQ